MKEHIRKINRTAQYLCSALYRIQEISNKLNTMLNNELPAFCPEASHKKDGLSFHGRFASYAHNVFIHATDRPSPYWRQQAVEWLGAAIGPQGDVIESTVKERYINTLGQLTVNGIDIEVRVTVFLLGHEKCKVVRHETTTNKVYYTYICEGE